MITRRTESSQLHKEGTVPQIQYLFPLLYQVSTFPSLNLFSRVPFSALTMTSVTSEDEGELRVKVEAVVVIPADTRLMLDSRESAELNSMVVFIS